MATTFPISTPWAPTGLVTQAAMDTKFTTPINDLYTLLANPPLAKMRNSAGQSVANSTPTALTWDTEDFDTAGGHSTSSNTSRYTCQTGTAGKYRVHGVAYWTGNATGVRETWLRVNGVDVPGSMARMPSATTGAMTAEQETIVQLAVGDYVEVFVQQTSGGALATTVGGVTYAQSFFEVQWISL